MAANAVSLLRFVLSDNPLDFKAISTSVYITFEASQKLTAFFLRLSLDVRSVRGGKTKENATTPSVGDSKKFFLDCFCSEKIFIILRSVGRSNSTRKSEAAGVLYCYGNGWKVSGWPGVLAASDLVADGSSATTGDEILFGGVRLSWNDSSFFCDRAGRIG